MNELVLDIKIKIASTIIDKFGYVWYKLTIADDEFARYTRSNEGIRLFIDLFTQVKRLELCGHFNLEYKLFGKKHRNHVDDLPAVIESYDSQLIESWYHGGMFHRINKPSMLVYNDKKLIRECYHNNNLLHRDNGPAYITYNDNEQIEIERWYRNGKLHRDDDLPAQINHINNSIFYFVNGIKYTPGKILADRVNSIIYLFMHLYAVCFIMSRYDGNFEGYFVLGFSILMITTPIRWFYENVFNMSNGIVKLWDMIKN